MKLSDAFPSKYISAADLGDSDVHVTIKKASLEVMGEGAEAKDKLILHFNEMPKPMVCNKTNANTIAKIHGDDTDHWIGQRISLFATEVEFGGEVTLGIRVRLRAPGNVTTARPAAAATSDPATITAKQSAWVKFKEANPGDSQQALATKLTNAVKTVFGTTPQALTAAQWNQLAAQDFDISIEQAATEIFAGEGVPADDIPF